MGKHLLDLIICEKNVCFWIYINYFMLNNKLFHACSAASMDFFPASCTKQNHSFSLQAVCRDDDPHVRATTLNLPRSASKEFETTAMEEVVNLCD